MRTKNEVWDILNVMLNDTGLVKQQLDSFDDFITHGMQEIVKEVGKIEPDIEGFMIRLDRIEIEEPKIREADGATRPIYPMEARIRNLTYGAPVYLYMTPVYEQNGIQTQEEQVRVYIGMMPIMLRSKKCITSNMPPSKLIKIGEDPKDPGGYFIISGSERVLVTQEDLAPNKILVENVGGVSNITSRAKVLSTAGGVRTPLTIERKKDGTISVNAPGLPQKIPLIIHLRALGLETDKEITEAIGLNPDIQKELLPSIEESMEVSDGEEALDYIGRRVAIGQTQEYRIKRAENVLNRYLLPHLGTTSESKLKKARFIGIMTRSIIELYLGIREEDDKDHYSNKRLRLAGDLLKILFRVAFNSLCRDIKYQTERASIRGKTPNLKTAVRADVITDRISHALATGNWVGGKTGVSQLLDRTNYISMLSHLRRVVSPLSRNQPHFQARDLHPTQWGKICPNETPEGPNCGLVKNLALMAHISQGTDEKRVLQILVERGMEPLERLEYPEGKTCVYLNGTLVGTHEKPEQLINEIRKSRRREEISQEINIAYHPKEKEVIVNCDSGRVRRPLVTIEDGKNLLEEKHIEMIRKGKLQWKDLIASAIIEYLDAEEEENAYIAVMPNEITKEHTHVEISPAFILGVSASLIPFAEHNQSPRNTYEAGMAKQALGLYAPNYRIRVDTRAHLLHYSQTPIVRTQTIDLIGYDKRAAGQNFVVAVLSYEGYNIEDALVINKASIERGLARSTFFRTYDAEERKYPGGQEDRFEIPTKDIRGYRIPEAYRYLNEDGIIEPETEVIGGIVIIGRTSPPRFIEEYARFEIPTPNRRETSITMRHGEKGVVDAVILTETNEGNRLLKVKIRDDRKPTLGDKFASRHGQKGVIGQIASQEDMPFTEDGIVPDLIINPHAMPSRMTVGQLIESATGIAAAMEGKPADGTPFIGITIKEIEKTLKKHGYHPAGETTLYDGITGEKYPARIYMGIVYMQRLHHLVADKIHARPRGPIQILTRQPTEGRAREGGLRFGEMERDCLIGHGAALLLKERLLEGSDKVEALICEKCGLLAVYDRSRDRYYCPVCDIGAKIANIEISYAFKLLLQELMSLGIAPRLRLKEKA